SRRIAVSGRTPTSRETGIHSNRTGRCPSYPASGTCPEPRPVDREWSTPPTGLPAPGAPAHRKLNVSRCTEPSVSCTKSWRRLPAKPGEPHPVADRHGGVVSDRVGGVDREAVRAGRGGIERGAVCNRAGARGEAGPAVAAGEGRLACVAEQHHAAVERSRDRDLRRAPVDPDAADRPR